MPQVLSFALDDRPRRQSGRPTSHVILPKDSVRNVGLAETDAKRHQFRLSRDRNENKVWVFAADQVTASGNGRMASLDCLMRDGHVFADDDVNVFNLQHGRLRKVERPIC